jgi:energy-coupling factor transport system substrate-specific component
MKKQLTILALIVALVALSPAYNIPWSVITTLAAILSLLLIHFRLEKTLHGSREIAVLGVLTAVVVALRQAVHGFEATPIFFVIILTGYVFGWTEGFIVGSTTLLVSNFIVGGHGPWTPYQMLAAGLVGALAAALPKTKKSKTALALLVVYGILSAYLYGAVTDVFWWLAFAREHTITTYLAVHMTGVLQNTARAVGNAMFTLLLGLPVLRVLSRFKKRFVVDYIN